MELSKLILFSCVNLHLGRDAEEVLIPFIANFMALTASAQTTAEGGLLRCGCQKSRVCWTVAQITGDKRS